MKQLIIVLLVIFFFSDSMAQKAIQWDTCTFRNLKFINGIDTAIIKVEYNSSLKSSDYSILKELDSEKKLSYDEFGVDTGEEENSVAISFKSIKCSKSYSATLSRKIYDTTYYNKKPEFAISTLKPGEMIFLTCVVFKKEITKSNPEEIRFFVIIDIAKERPRREFR